MTTPRRFEDMPIRDKLRLIIVIISGLAVLMACTVFVTYQWVSGRSSISRRMHILTDIVADQSTAALEFSQAPQAAAILASLRADRQIVTAALYTKDGRLFASYRRDGDGSATPPSRPEPDGETFQGRDFVVSQPVLSSGERIGTFYIRTDRSEAWRRLRVNLATVGLVLLGAIGASLFLAGRLGGLVTEPVMRLARVVQTVSIRRDYAVRVESRGHDELGRLIDGFNDMLVQIQERDTALARARDDLEFRVQERTRELQDEIAERRSAQALLQEKDARLTEAQVIARLGSWEWLPHSNALSWSEEMYRIYGVPPSAYGGRFGDYVGLAYPEDRGGLEAALESAARTREPFVHEYRIIRPDGSVHYLHARGKTIAEEGLPVRVVGTAQDVTERKLSEQSIHDLNLELQARMGELASANRDLEGFSYSVSHDLRAPLRAIDGFSQMLAEDCAEGLDEVGQRYLDTISQNTRRMGRLIDDLLDFSRLGRKTLATSTVDVASLAREVFAELREQAPGREMELRLSELPPGHADPAMMRQVLVNLLSNAIKYTRGRSPAIIEMGAHQSEGATVYFVRDNGIGFDMKYADKLFGVFQRLHSSGEFEGTGVGLALVQRIVERHGGRVWGEGRVGEGATFSFSVPAHQEAGVLR